LQKITFIHLFSLRFDCQNYSLRLIDELKKGNPAREHRQDNQMLKDKDVKVIKFQIEARRISHGAAA